MNTLTPAELVTDFLKVVRSGKRPDAAANFLAPAVLAHQLNGEGRTTLVRTPADYAAHIRDFRTLFGDFELVVEELLAQGDRVFVRWRQTGRHVTSFAGEAPTGAPLVELASVVYRVESGQIVEYWLHLDRLGLQLQVEAAVNSGALHPHCNSHHM